MSLKNLYLGWPDYAMLVVFLGLSSIIGIWHGCFGNKQTTTKDFLMAGGNMGMLPTAMSLFATLCSASTLLGIPVEIYYYGTMYLYFLLSWIIAAYLTSHIFIPKFRELGFISIYKYIEQRFSLTLRISVTLTFIVSLIMFMSVILYGPCLALSQVTGLDVWLAIISCGVICTFYTSIGGMKAVIWTDVVQSFIMFLGVVLSIVLGFSNAGGIKKVLEIAIAGQRIDFFNISFDPTIRYTIWTALLGGTCYALSCSSILQTQTQRYMCVDSTREAQKAIWINTFLLVLLLLLCGIVGLLIYAKYHDCDPLRAKFVSRSDQFYPLFVMETFSRFPGLTGLFIAAVMSGSLSSISSGVNSIATVIMEDIWKPLMSTRIPSDKLQTIISKYMSVVLGLLTILLAFLMSYLTNILVIVYSVTGTLAAPIFGLFLLGFFFPRVNNRSACIAYFITLVFQLWVLIGANFTLHQQPKRILPISIDGCTSLNLNNITLNTINSKSINNDNNLFLPLYSISFMWYGFNGVLLTVIIGLVCSLFCGNSKSEVNKIDSYLLISCRQTVCCCGSNDKNSQYAQETFINGRKYEQVDGIAPEDKELVIMSSSHV
ncbi:unnamed protein product [Rotaria sordida]|uniref:Sodium-coupled monocarboxylate transporter 1 n=1 Tax=Rotaria sordida TaxID=392033 RepID=A0A814UHL8_9BILA|nr:unnamed protein product [Rotaria sordida]